MTAGAVTPFTDEEERSGRGLVGLVKILRRRRRVFLLTAAGVTLAFGLYTVFRRVTAPVYTGGFNLLITDPINQNAPAAEGEGAIGAVARNVSRVDLPTLIRVLESPSVLEPVYASLEQSYPGQKLPSIDVSLVPVDEQGGNPIIAGGLIGVTARGSSPDMLREALQLTQKAYLDWSLQQRREKLTEGVKFLDEQAPELQDKANALQGQLQRFRTANSVVEPQADAAAVRGQVEELRTRVREQEVERQRLRQLRGDVASGRLTTRSFSTSAGTGTGTGSAGATGDGGAGSSSVTLDVPNQSLLEQLNTLEQQIAEARSKYQPDSAVLRNLIASRDKLRPELQAKELQAIDAAIEQLDLSIAGSRRQIAQLEGRFSDQPALMREYEDLQSRLEIANENLASYQRTRDQFQLEIAQNNVPWKVTSPTAVNPVPVEPRLGRGLLQGLLLGLVAGTGAALVRDRFDHVFHTSVEVREDLGVPLLGHVPHIPFFSGVRREKRFLLQELDAQRSGLQGYQRFAYQEAFRNLYTSLRFLRSGRPVKSVAVSSSLPSEGKSLVIVLLAKTLSELGQKVLLVDSDLRQPQVHLRLGLDNLQGLSTLLTDDSAGWRDVVQTIDSYPGWNVITAGQRVPDPPRLLGSTRMAELVRDIAENGGYDLVLYDTPPALGLADASLVAEQLDGMVLLVSLNKVDRNLPAESIRRIEAAGAPLLGVVTNSLRPSDETLAAYGGYGGYGSYGGYAGRAEASPAHDPSLAYSYYHRNGGQEETNGRPKGMARFVPNRRNLARWRDAIRHWMEGSG